VPVTGPSGVDTTLTMRSLQQPLATHGDGFRVLLRLPLIRFAADCHRLQPLSSINAPSFVVKHGDAVRAEKRQPRQRRVMDVRPKQPSGATTGRSRAKNASSLWARWLLHDAEMKIGQLLALAE
jgi:hypothetical protein